MPKGGRGPTTKQTKPNITIHIQNVRSELTKAKCFNQVIQNKQQTKRMQRASRAARDLGNSGSDTVFIWSTYYVNPVTGAER